jgi:antitoxin YefM
MLETTANEFRKTLKNKVDTCIESHMVLKVKRRSGGNFVIISEEDWLAIEETLFLNRIPGLAQSIQDAANEPLNEGTPLKEISW